MTDEVVRKVARRLAGDEQVCAECGDSVKPGSGKYVNRVPILDSFQERLEWDIPIQKELTSAPSAKRG